jgi:hypothetical protein
MKTMIPHKNKKINPNKNKSKEIKININLINNILILFNKIISFLMPELDHKESIKITQISSIKMQKKIKLPNRQLCLEVPPTIISFFLKSPINYM